MNKENFIFQFSEKIKTQTIFDERDDKKKAIVRTFEKKNKDIYFRQKERRGIFDTLMKKGICFMLCYIPAKALCNKSFALSLANLVELLLLLLLLLFALLAAFVPRTEKFIDADALPPTGIC